MTNNPAPLPRRAFLKGACVQALSTPGPVTLWAMADAFSDSLETSYRNREKGTKVSRSEDAGPQTAKMDVPPERRFAGLDGAKSSMTGIFGRMATYSGQVVTWEDAINSEVVLGTDAERFDAPAPVQPGADNAYPVSIPGSDGVL